MADNSESSSFFPGFLYATVEYSQRCPSPSCEESSNSTVSLICRGCEQEDLIKPGNIITAAVVYNIWILRLIPLPLIALGVWMQQSWPLFVLVTLGVFLYFGMYLRRYPKQLAEFWLLGLFVVSAMGACLYLLVLPEMEQEFDRFGFRDRPSLVTYAHDSISIMAAIYRSAISELLAFPVSVSEPISSVIGATLNAAFELLANPAALLPLIMVTTAIFFGMWITWKRTEVWSTMLSVTFWSILLGLGGVLWWFDRQGLHAQAIILIRIITFFALSLLGSITVAAIIAESRRSGKPIHLKLFDPIIGSSPWRWNDAAFRFHSPEVPPGVRLGTIQRVARSILRPIILIANGIVKAVTEVSNWVLHVADLVIKGALRLLSLILDVVLRLSYRVYRIVIEFLRMLLCGVDFFAAHANFLKSLLFPLILLALTGLTVHHLSETIFAYIFNGGVPLLFGIMIDIAVIGFSVALMIFMLLKNISASYFANEILRSVSSHGGMALIMFLAYSWTLILTSAITRTGPFRLGPVTISLTLIVIGVFVFLLLMGRFNRASGRRDST